MKYFFNNLKVTHQLLIVMVLIVVTFVAVAYNYYSILGVQEKQAQNIERLENFEQLIDEANIHFLHSRRKEKEFLLSGEQQTIDEFVNYWDETRTDLDLLAVVAPKELNQSDIKLMHKHVTEFGKSFREMANNRFKLGLTIGQTDGLLPDLQKLSETIENTVRRQDDLNLIGPVMIVRNQERKYAFDLQPQRLTKISSDIKNLATQLRQSAISKTAKVTVAAELKKYNTTLEQAIVLANELDKVSSAYRNAATKAEPLFKELVHKVKVYNQQIKDKAKRTSGAYNHIFLVTLFGAVVWVAILLLFIQRSMGSSISKLLGTVQAVQKGNYSARTQMKGSNEFSQFGQTLDQMLNDRIDAAQKVELENETINNAVIDLLETAAQLSSNDLTVKAKVTEDVTGPVADAINQMVTETVRVLKQIQDLAQQVNDASMSVRTQGDKVDKVAQEERSLLEITMENLDKVAVAMRDVAKLAQTCNQFAKNASENTLLAVETVHNTAKGMHEIRETISETEKRIKRLGERSQEITGIVDIINTIAERTHVLALNASMQAAAAGDAGRGFAVVADEVQRLAESSRNSTSQIASLVQNIQSETAETMVTMNDTITQVVAGSDLAEKAGQQMLATKDTTEKLANSVEKIANQSLEQANYVTELQQEADKLRQSTMTTNEELSAQKVVTEQLVDHAKKLNESVNTFALPA